MGLSNRHWQTPLTFEDFQFEQGRLVYIRGMRPQYIDGYALINAMEQLAVLAQHYKAVYDNVPEQLRIRIEHHVKYIHHETRFDPGLPDGITGFEPPKEVITHTSISRQPLSPDADPGGDSSGQ